MVLWRFTNAYSASKLQLDKNEMGLQSIQKAFVQPEFPWGGESITGCRGEAVHIPGWVMWSLMGEGCSAPLSPPSLVAAVMVPTPLKLSLHAA